MDLKNVSLGKAPDSGVGKTIKPKNEHERLAFIENKLSMLTEIVARMQKAVHLDEKREEEMSAYEDVNRDGLTIGSNFIGTTKGMTYVLTVQNDAYYIGATPYASLSAAAEGVSGVRRSGWTFWKLPDGRTVKEVYRRTRHG